MGDVLVSMEADHVWVHFKSLQIVTSELFVEHYVIGGLCAVVVMHCMTEWGRLCGKPAKHANRHCVREK